MRFLLSAGADPEQVSRSRKPSDEIGAQEISRWLGITWNDLVEQTRGNSRIAPIESPLPLQILQYLGRAAEIFSWGAGSVCVAIPSVVSEHS